MDGMVQSPTPKASGSFFTPLLISMAGIVSTSIIIVLYHLVLVKYCRRRSGHNNTSRGRASRRRRGPVSESQLAADGANGVEKKILEAIPILSYSCTKKDSFMFRVDQSECVVCLGELEDGDVVRLLPSCRHVFHVCCIDEWFSGHTSCPICRSPIVAPPVSSIMVPLGGVVDIGDANCTVDTLPRQVSNHIDQGGDGCGGDCGGNSSTSQVQPGVLRHCVSLVMPMEERRPRRLITGLKRSLSMDQSYVLFNRQREISQRNLPSSSCSSSSIFKGTTTRSVRQLDRVSSMLARSFSLLRMGRSSTSNGILPY